MRRYTDEEIQNIAELLSSSSLEELERWLLKVNVEIKEDLNGFLLDPANNYEILDNVTENLNLSKDIVNTMYILEYTKDTHSNRVKREEERRKKEETRKRDDEMGD